MGHRRMLAAPDVVFGGLMNHLAFRIDDHQGIKIPISDDLRPARLTLHNNIDFVVLGQPSQIFRLLPRNVNKNVTGSSDMGNVKNLVREASQGTLWKRNQFHRKVNGDNPHRRMDGVLNRL